MAVYAAHLTRTLQGTPSIFQVTAQEALGDTVKPAFKKLVEYLAAVYPKKLGWTLEWYDEMFLLLDACLQYHYLKHYAASFSENFYGLMRVPLSSGSEFSSGTRLPARLELGSLLALVALPYLRGKIELLVERWRQRQQDGSLGKSRAAVVRVYSWWSATTTLGWMVQRARYLAGGTRCAAPDLAALGLALRNAPPTTTTTTTTDYLWTDLLQSIRKRDFRVRKPALLDCLSYLYSIAAIRFASYHAEYHIMRKVGVHISDSSDYYVRDIKSGATLTFPMVGGALLRAAEYGAFLVQLLRWWEGAAPLAAPLPTPPTPPRPHQQRARRGECPVCRRPWRTPTALSVSGYIFCYSCISRELRASAVCPVTRLPAAEHQLVRCYID